MNYKLLLLICSLFLAELGFSQKTVTVSAYIIDKVSSAESDTIYYSPLRRLAWGDFSGAPEKDHFGDAVTSSGFAYGAGITMKDGHLEINVGVYTFFNKSKSWRRSFISSDYHLQHEQHHFDITRFGAERFCEEIRKAKFTATNYKEVLNDVFDKIYNENLALQDQYDNETEHSINKDKQLAWNDKISGEVKKLFSHPL
jgi:hypothetical protein